MLIHRSFLYKFGNPKLETPITGATHYIRTFDPEIAVCGAVGVSGI